MQYFNLGGGNSIRFASGTPTPIVDPDAQAFITAAAITDPTQQSAINNLVVGLKADGIWSKMKAIYPFVGGTSSTHKFNLKNPLDTDAAFRLVFYGGWTHSSTGATPNGTNAYADMFFNPTLVSTANSASLGYYSRSSSTSTVNNYVIGASDNTGFWALILRNSLKLLRITNVSTAFEDAQNTTALSTSGFYIGSQDISNIKLFRNSVNIAQNSATDARTLLNNKLYLAASRNFAGVAENFSLAQSAFAFVGDYLTDTEATNLNTRVTTFQTALNRNV